MLIIFFMFADHNKKIPVVCGGQQKKLYYRV